MWLIWRNVVSWIVIFVINVCTSGFFPLCVWLSFFFNQICCSTDNFWLFAVEETKTVKKCNDATCYIRTHLNLQLIDSVNVNSNSPLGCWCRKINISCLGPIKECVWWDFFGQREKRHFLWCYDVLLQTAAV